MDNGTVVAVSCESAHRFSKPVRESIHLIADYGVEGDAHAGATIQHRYLAKRNLPNDRQVHLIASELFDDLAVAGFTIGPGDLGENVTCRGIDLAALPLRTRLNFGEGAVVELTGLRTPCGLIDKFRRGLKRTLILRTPEGPTFRSGVLGVVRVGGIVSAGNRITATLPDEPWKTLPAI
jgi:MOSC domain-containing protein YiiM